MVCVNTYTCVYLHFICTQTHNHTHTNNEWMYKFHFGSCSVRVWDCLVHRMCFCCNATYRCTLIKIYFPFVVTGSPLLSITSGSSWLYVEWNAQSATFRVLYRESGAPDYQVIVPRPSQLSHNISALQPNTLYNIVVEATHTQTQKKVNSSVTSAYTIPNGELRMQKQILCCGYMLLLPLIACSTWEPLIFWYERDFWDKDRYVDRYRYVDSLLWLQIVSSISNAEHSMTLAKQCNELH